MLLGAWRLMVEELALQANVPLEDSGETL
jgi:hypothetical protein